MFIFAYIISFCDNEYKKVNELCGYSYTKCLDYSKIHLYVKWNIIKTGINIRHSKCKMKKRRYYHWMLERTTRKWRLCTLPYCVERWLRLCDTSASDYKPEESLKKRHQWCFDWRPTFPLPLPHLSCGWNKSVTSECHIHTNPYLKTHTHIYLLHKRICTESEYNWVLLMCIPVKYLISFPHSTQSGSFHRQSIFHILLIIYYVYI